MLKFQWMRLLVSGWLFLAMQGTAPCQDRILSEPLPARLLTNLQQLQITVAMDRSRYLPGEVATVSVSIFNPAKTQLEIPDPDDEQVGFEICSKNGMIVSQFGLEWSCLLSDIAPQASVRTRVILPGERIERSYRSEDFVDRCCRWDSDVGVQAGAHKVIYGLGGEVPYEILQAKLEAFAAPVLNTKGEADDSDTGEHTKFPLAVMIAALGADGQHFICVSTESIEATRPPTLSADLNGFLTADSALALRPARRIVAVKGPIVSLRAKAGDDDQLTITYSMADGMPHTIVLDGDRNVARIM